MTRARDVANVLSTASDLATDTETAAAISSHNSATTSVHGIANTANLATQAYVQANKGIQSGNTASRPASPSNGDVYSNTETGFLEVYSSVYGWEQIGGISSTVTGVTATNSPTNRAFNNGAASIAFTPGTILGRTYTVTSTPGSYTATGSSSPITITGLQSSTQYTYTVTATNNYGTSSASSASSGVTATTVPQAPTLSAVGGDTNATITITPGATGGSTVTQYSIISNPTTTTQTTSNTTYTFTGLTNNTSYTFTGTATNANGTSLASAATSSITPAAFAGYLYGGNSGGVVNTINRLAYSTDSYSTLSATTPASTSTGAGSANSGTAGYAYGGYESTYSNRIAKLAFNGETVSTLAATLATAVYGNSSFSNNGTAGFSANGHEGTTFLSQVTKLSYSNDTRSSGGSVGPLYLTTGISNKGSAGYTVGGYSWSLNFQSTIYKYTFSNDTGSALGTSYPVAAYNIASWENNGTAGYAAGGGESMYSGVHKLPFATDTLSGSVASLAAGGDWASGLSHRNNAGYYCLGRISRTNTSKFPFATDTRSELVGTLTSRYGMSAMSNSGAF